MHNKKSKATPPPPQTKQNIVNMKKKQNATNIPHTPIPVPTPPPQLFPLTFTSSKVN